MAMVRVRVGEILRVHVFRLQKVTTEAESNTTIDKLQKKFNELRVSAYKEMAARIGVFRLVAFVR